MNFSFLPEYWSYFNYGVLVTIMISACVVFFGTIIGILVALAKRTNSKILNAITSFYAPIIGFGVLNLDFSRLLPGIIIISLNSGAYISEIVRAGIEAVPKGQLEAAYSLGIRPVNAMRYVILPQALKNILPALGNEFITIIKDSSLLQTIGVMELWSGAQSVVTATYLPVTPLLFAAFYYLMVTTVLSFLLKQLEKRMGNGARN